MAEEIDAALERAAGAFEGRHGTDRGRRISFLRAAAAAVEALGNDLIDCCHRETALPAARLQSERGRTVNQIRMFADLVEEGSWVEARIDHADYGRTPPKPDLRRMLIPLGPVAVFGASNFPLAFSVAGGDTASALAAGCPVVVMVHPAHPETSKMVAAAVSGAARESGMPEGTFSILQGEPPEVGLELVRHPRTRAVGFTGSLRAGRAIFDAAAARPDPVPVFAEMGSTNPVFILPGALARRGASMAEGLHASATLGVGQFCTQPGIVFAVEGDGYAEFVGRLRACFEATPAGTMLTEGIRRNYEAGLAVFEGFQGVTRASGGGGAALLETSAATFAEERGLGEEVFGPCTLLVTAASLDELVRAAKSLVGQLTATLHAEEADAEAFERLQPVLEERAGRLICNGYPTGVEVCSSMHHSGPWPATSDARVTSVGTAAIQRFVRPVCFQDFAQARLPDELKDGNPLGISRMVNGRWEVKREG